MSHPYVDFEGDPLWAVIDAAVHDLAKNGDIELTTTKEYVIGYICQQVRAALPLD